MLVSVEVNSRRCYTMLCRFTVNNIRFAVKMVRIWTKHLASLLTLDEYKSKTFTERLFFHFHVPCVHFHDGYTHAICKLYLQVMSKEYSIFKQEYIVPD